MIVTFAANQADMGGGEVMLLAMAAAATDSGHDARVVAPSGELARASIERGFPTTVVRSSSTIGYLRALRRWASSERTGLLWCNGLRPAFATAGQANRVVHLHQPPTRAQRLAAHAAIRGAARVVVPSEFMRSVCPGRPVVVENWTEPLPVTARSMPLAVRPVTVGFLGRLSPDKGVTVLAEALTKLDREQPGTYRLFLAGEPRFVSSRDSQAVDKALTPIEHITQRAGWVSREDFFDAVDLAVFPSVWEEPFGLVAAEAMSVRCPFIITDSGALPSVAGPEFPWIARRGDPADLARQISRATRAYTERQLTESHQRWRDLYSPEAGRRRLAGILDQIGGHW